MNLPTGVLTGYIAPFELRDEFDRFECNGSLDASEFVAAGSIARRDYGPVCTLAYRHVLDAYEFTDRTAVHTDCASAAL